METRIFLLPELGSLIVLSPATAFFCISSYFRRVVKHTYIYYTYYTRLQTGIQRAFGVWDLPPERESKAQWDRSLPFEHITISRTRTREKEYVFWWTFCFYH